MTLPVRQSNRSAEILPLTVAGSIFLAGHKSLGVEETPVCAIPDLIDDVGLKVDIEGPGHVFARGGLREEGAEAIVVGGGGAVNETTIGLFGDLDGNFGWGRVDTHAETVLDGVELPCESYDRQYRSTTH